MCAGLGSPIDDLAYASDDMEPGTVDHSPPPSICLAVEMLRAASPAMEPAEPTPSLWMHCDITLTRKMANTLLKLGAPLVLFHASKTRACACVQLFVERLVHMHAVMKCFCHSRVELVEA